ncbi:hypothetical protein GE061_012946 [Apolygus lucorum]|uniref:Uncharacterized protein n=1 Tax=Apolygus lucorum TaxID=248454 RepID=A0A8S9XU10_APOLU|nr:hypothetical protein GE061_012946 [Apolygus lucorum]
MPRHRTPPIRTVSTRRRAADPLEEPPSLNLETKMANDQLVGDTTSELVREASVSSMHRQQEDRVDFGEELRRLQAENSRLRAERSFSSTMLVHEAPLLPYDGKSEWEEYLTHVEVVSTLNQWDEDRKAQREEIGEVFDKWTESQQPKVRKSDETTEGVACEPRLSSWTENVLASWSEFDRVIAQELSALMADAPAPSQDDGTDSSGGSSPNFSRLHDEEADSGLERSAEVLDRASVTYEDCGAQTSPAVSRSSSFTWLSDSSSLPEEEEVDTSSSSSSPHPDSSGDSHKEDTSPPPANSPKSCQKCRRKETWERLRRRQSSKDGQSAGGRTPKETVWVRRQSHAMAESSSEPDLVGDRGSDGPQEDYPDLSVRPDFAGLPRPGLAVRPTTLRLGPPSSCSGSSLPSPSSECGGVTVSGSPQQELATSKSSSAPLLHHTRSSTLPHIKTRGKPRSQSEKQLPGLTLTDDGNTRRKSGQVMGKNSGSDGNPHKKKKNDGRQEDDPGKDGETD